VLVRVGRLARGPGAPRIRRVVAESRAEAANPFEWEDVMFDQDYVREVLTGVVALVHGSTEVRCGGCEAA
jgi:hypothetical protein